MKISELIARLTEIAATEGDIEVRCWAENPESWTSKPVEYLTLTREHGHGPAQYVTIEDEDGEPWESRHARYEALRSRGG